MTGHLILVSLGPVQDFIAQARRTRDLWYGSHLLSELARCAARTLTERGARLVFPALEKDDAQLEPCSAPLRRDGTPPLAIANKILAELPKGDPEPAAKACRAEVFRFWREKLAEPVLTQKCDGLLADGIDAVWNEQIDTFLEFAASWVPLDRGYAQARRDLEQTLAARKRLRDFPVWIRTRGGVPKSSLDGARETVLAAPEHRAKKLIRKYRIPDGEQLDAIGLVKRAGGEPGQFAPVASVAFASWIARAKQEHPELLAGLSRECTQIGLSRVDRDIPCARPFPFDAEVLLLSRWKGLFEEIGFEGDAQAWSREHIRPLLKAMGEPFPYVACLVADGDRMGAAIDDLSSADEHRAFSRSLAQFATATREIVETRHLGSLVYAGGDDVVAFLPLPEAVACANDLRLKFTELMAKVPHGNEGAPTLSVGLGIGHLLEGMGDLLDLGREAEKLAKGAGRPAAEQRNALALVLDKRSGGKRSWRGRWDRDPAKRLSDDAKLIGEGLSTKKIYEIAAACRRLPDPKVVEGQDWRHVLAREVQRSLARNLAGEAALKPDDVGLDLAPEDYGELRKNVEGWVDRMLISRMIAGAAPRSRGREEAA